jgi:predicted transcriptional regulator of viral defense system
MAGKTRTAERAVADIAAKQLGLVGRGQLRACGVGDNTVDRWVSWGRLRPVHRGVFALGGTPIGDRGRLMAAALACSPATVGPGRGVGSAGVVLSHRSAGFLLGLTDPLPRVLDVICLGRAGRGIDGIRPHFVDFPEPHERVLVDGIPCTDVARTLVDLAGTLGDRSLRESLERAATGRALDLAAIEAVLAKRRRRGNRRLRVILDEWRPVAELAGESKVRTPFEARLLPLLAAGGVPMPAVNARVAVATRTLEVDLLWRAQRLVVEADSRRHHGIEVAFERDRRRDRELLDAGYAIIRVTARQAEGEAEAIAGSIRRLLERRAGGPDAGPLEPHAAAGITQPGLG